ncbi:MAG: MFS transporter, partial [Acidimicrobiales bacterium]
VYGILKASEWGWLRDSNSPFTVFGLALTPFVIGAGLVILGLFLRWTERRVEHGKDPLFRLGLFDIKPFKVGLEMFLGQNILLMGVFFSLPLYLQVVLGLDALETGVRMLPVSVAMFIFSFAGARMSQRWTPRTIVRAGLWVLLGSVVLLMATIEPQLEGLAFGLAMSLLGVGMGLLASQLGNLVQSSVGQADRSEAGGLQYTAQQLGSSIGTAFIGAIVISSLTSVFLNQVAEDPDISDKVEDSLTVELNGSIEFVPASELGAALADSGLDDDEAEAIVEAYEDGQLIAIKIGLLVGGLIVVAMLFVARRIPSQSFEEIAAEAAASSGDPPTSEIEAGRDSQQN